ncbi:MAG: sensor domain-containing diguanylate cyclase [Leptospiraceae bacterium]|nr:sensor domain-containing diguanylate cyclase [Leptospiraceae bacterium]MCP5497624.1 sensor domain-containing diguanylate cyclase [Leptospiraceae bacterium]
MYTREEDFPATIVIEQYEKKIYDQKQLLEISKALNSQLDYNFLIDAILNICLAQFQTMMSAIYIAPEIDVEYFQLYPGHKGFEFEDEDLKRKISVESPLIQYLEEKTRAISIKQLEKTIQEQSDDLSYFKKIGAEMVIPLNAKGGKINGIIILGEKMTMGEYLDSEKEFLTILASLAGVAVENSRLYELATVDMMTQLKIHHYFQSKLREEMDRCRKKNTTMALLFTDIDKFKVFNDTYGHQAGDIVLIEVAKKLMESVRKVDLAARYGGEEFCVVMPGANAQDGFEMGEKIRKAVESHTVIDPNTRQELKVTISVGVTEFHPNDKNNREIIERSDKALYEAKHSGRNRTMVRMPESH